MRADLVLEGGGVRGVGLLGAVSVLEEAGYRFQRIAGTSAGAVVGALLAAGLPASRMARLLDQVPLRSFADPAGIGRLPLVGPGLSLLASDGLYRGDALERWVADQLDRLGVRTFADLRLADPLVPTGQRYRLVAIAADVSENRLVRLPWDYPHYGLDPDAQPVAAAVRASASIPFFYQPVRLPVAHRGTAVLLDGGLLSNFPVDTFDRRDGEPRWPTFGVRLSARPDATWLPHPIPGGPVGLTVAMLHTLVNFHDQMHLDDPCVLARTIFVDAGKVSAVDFDITPERRQLLFDQGAQAARAFLRRWDWPAYLRDCRSR